MKWEWGILVLILLLNRSKTELLTEIPDSETGIAEPDEILEDLARRETVVRHHPCIHSPNTSVSIGEMCREDRRESEEDRGQSLHRECREKARRRKEVRRKGGRKEEGIEFNPCQGSNADRSSQPPPGPTYSFAESWAYLHSPDPPNLSSS